MSLSLCWLSGSQHSSRRNDVHVPSGKEANMNNELLIQMHLYRLNGSFDRFSAYQTLYGCIAI